MKKRSHLTKLSVFLSCALLLTACGNDGVKEHDHVWDAGEITKAATCHSEGVKTYHCTVPGCEQTKLENLAMTPHNWDAGVIETPATCGEAGSKVYTCQNEGCDQTRVVAIPKTNDHHFEPGEVTRIPDLLEDGERQMVCSVCGEVSAEAIAAHADFAEQFALQDSHWTYGSVASFEPSQTSLLPSALTFHDGIYSDENVQIHQGSVSSSLSYAVLGYQFASFEDMHVHVATSFQSNSDTNKANAFLVQVNAENAVKSVSSIATLATSWNYAPEEENDIQKGDTLYLVLGNEAGGVAGELSFTLTAECVHVWDEGKVKKEATCAEEGIYEYTCIRCGETKTRPIAKTDHTFDEGVITKAPTETEEGVITYTCSVCHTTKEESIPALGVRIASYHDDFSTAGNNLWHYGYSSDYNYDNNTFTFTSLEKVSDEEWGGVSGLTAKKDWVQSEAEGKDLAVAYDVPRGQDHLKLDVSFASVEAANKETRMAARVLVLDNNGATKSATFLDDGQSKADWNRHLEVDALPGDRVYVILFREAAAWPQGVLNVEIFGNAIPSTDPYLDLTGKVSTRFDDDGGNIDLEANSWASENGLEAHVEVTKACGEVWRAGMFIDTKYALSAGKTYEVSFDAAAKNDGPFEVILQPEQWADVGQRYAFLDRVGHHSVEVYAASDASLWFLIQAGTAVNEITISNILIQEKVIVDTGDYVNMIGKVSTRFDDDGGNIDLEANSWASENGLEAHAEVTKACGEVWRAGMFVDTGVAFEKGRTYEVSFDVARKSELPFELVLQNAQWADVDHRYDFVSEPGHYSKRITVADGMEGSLWILVQLGNTVNEITVSNLSVVELN